MNTSKPTDDSRWPADGPHRKLLQHLDRVREDNGRRSLQRIADGMHLRSATRVNDVLRGLSPPTDQRQLLALVRAMGGGRDDAETAASLFRTMTGSGRGHAGEALRPELPRLPGHFVPRPQERREALRHLRRLAESGGGALGLATAAALHGTGGFGKTTLALEVCRRPEAAEMFPDGVVWVELGQDPVVTDVLADVTSRITRRQPLRYATTDAAAAAFVDAVGDKQLLVVLDNAWHPADVDPFLRGGPRCVRLVTTRRLDVLPRSTPTVAVGRMTPDHAVEVLCADVPGATPDAVYPLYERSRRWPVLLGVLNGVLRGRTERASAQPLPEIVSDLVSRLDRGGITGVDDITDPHLRTAHEVLELGLTELAAEPRGRLLHDRMIGLAAFPADHLITYDSLQRLWGCDATGARVVCDRLADRSLLGSVESNGVRLHDVVHAHLTSTHSASVRRWSEELLSVLRSRCPGGAWHRFPEEDQDELGLLAFLLASTDHDDELVGLLFDLRYLVRRIRQGGLAGLAADVLVGQTLGPRNPRLDALDRVLALEGHLATRVTQPSAVAATLVSRLVGEPTLMTRMTGTAEAVGTAPVALHALPDRPDARLLRVLTGHEERVLCLTWRPDGELLASGAADGVIRIWDGRGVLQRSITVDAAVNALSWSPDQLHLAALAGDRSVHRVDPLHGDVLHTTTGLHEITALAWSPDSSELALGGADGSVLLGSGAAAPGTDSARSGSPVRAVAWSTAGLVSAHSDGTITCWNTSPPTSVSTRLNVPRALHIRPGHSQAAVGGADRGILVVELDPVPTPVMDTGPHEGWITALRWNCDGSRLAAGRQDGHVDLWDSAVGATPGHDWDAMMRARPAIDHHGVRVAALEWHPAEPQLLAVGAATDVRLFDVTRPARRLRHDGINCLAWHPRLPHIAAGGMDGELLLLDDPAAAPASPRSRHGHPEQVRALRYSPDGRWIASVAERGPMLLWSTATLDAEPAPCPVSLAGAVAWAPDGSWLAVGGQREVAVVDRRLQVVRRIDVPDLVNSLDIDPSGTWIAVATSGSSITVHHLPTGTAVSLDGHLSSVGSVRWTNSGTLISGGYDGAALVWSLDQHDPVLRLDAGNGAVWDTAVHDGRGITVTSAGMLGWHDLTTGETGGHIALDTALSSCAVSSDGVLLAAGGAAGLAIFRLTGSGSPSAGAG